MDKQKIISAIIEKFDIRLTPDDPAFVLVEMNRLALQETITGVVGQFDGLLSKLEQTEPGYSTALVIGTAVMGAVIGGMVVAVAMLAFGPSGISAQQQKEIRWGAALEKIYPSLDEKTRTTVNTLILKK